MTASPDVLVVGAGPTGLALAVELRAQKTPFRIVDRQRDRLHSSRALAIQPRTLEVLFRHGLADRLVELGNPAVSLRLHGGRKTARADLFGARLPGTAYPFLLFLSQAETERVLAEHLAGEGVEIERGVELADLTVTDAGATVCQLRHDGGAVEEVRPRYVVGCDGGRSAVRERAGIEFPGFGYPQAFLLADLEADNLEPGAVHAWAAPAGLLFMFPLGAPATWRLIAVRPPGTPDDPVSLELLQRVVDHYAVEPPRLRDPVWMTDFRLHHRRAASYRRGPVLVAGDAAHVHTPAGAQGMNTGIQDAANLGWKLAQVIAGQAPPSLLDTYHAERAPIGEAVLRLTDRAFTAAAGGRPLLGRLRTALAPRIVPVVLRIGPLARFAFRTVAELGISYRESPLSVNGPDAPRQGPKAGDRVPDLAVVAAGEPTTLHCVIAPPCYHLLLFGPPELWDGVEAGPAVIVHRVQGPATAFPSPSHYLVRPDGHVAYRNAGTDLSGLRAYLARWLLP